MEAPYKSLGRTLSLHSAKEEVIKGVDMRGEPYTPLAPRETASCLLGLRTVPEEVMSYRWGPDGQLIALVRRPGFLSPGATVPGIIGGPPAGA